MTPNNKFSKIVLICLMALNCPLNAEEAETYRLPNGLEVRAVHLANTGIVHARLVFSWTEGTEHAPIGTAWIMSKVLPSLGSGGMDRETFHSNKDQAGVLSRIDAGRGWIAWIFEAVPANADLMIQFLADEALRPSWAKSERLPRALAKANDDLAFGDARERLVHVFRNEIGDANIPQLPTATIDEDPFSAISSPRPLPVVPTNREQFVTMWTKVIRRPEKAVLSVTGDLATISLKRAVNQHFGPWEGIRPDKPIAATAKTFTAKWPKRTVYVEIGTPEAWIAWNTDALAPEDAAPAMALAPWLLRAAMPISDEIIGSLEADPDGRWVRAVAQANVSPEKLESRLKSLLNLSVTQDMLDRAISARNEHVRAHALYPGRAARQPNLNNAAPPTLDEARRIMKKCMEPDNLAVLVL